MLLVTGILVIAAALIPFGVAMYKMHISRKAAAGQDEEKTANIDLALPASGPHQTTSHMSEETDPMF